MTNPISGQKEYLRTNVVTVFRTGKALLSEVFFLNALLNNIIRHSFSHGTD